MTYREKLLSIGTVNLYGLVDLGRAEQVVIEADAEIAGLRADAERIDAKWREELRIYRETENARIAGLESRLSKLLHAAENVRRWDWSDNDEDCVDDILKLGDAIDAARANGGAS